MQSMFVPSKEMFSLQHNSVQNFVSLKHCSGTIYLRRVSYYLYSLGFVNTTVNLVFHSSETNLFPSHHLLLTPTAASIHSDWCLPLCISQPQNSAHYGLQPEIIRCFQRISVDIYTISSGFNCSHLRASGPGDLKQTLFGELFWSSVRGHRTRTISFMLNKIYLIPCISNYI